MNSDGVYCILLQHLMKPNYDVVKRWVNEAQEAVSSDNTMVQVWKVLGIVSLSLGLFGIGLVIV